MMTPKKKTEILELITIGEQARQSMINISEHFIKNDILKKDEFFDLVQRANDKLKIEMKEDEEEKEK
jgi:hypothetical protein